MRLLKKLKSNSIVSAILISIFLLLFTAVFINGSQFWLFLQEPQNLHDVPRDQLEGAYVTVELPCIYGSYAYTEEYENDFDKTGTIIAMEYLIDANYYDYCGLLVETDEMIEQANALEKQTYQYNYYEIDEITATFTVTGVMKKMPNDSLGFYHEAVGYDDMTAEEQDIYLPYYLDVRDSGESVGSVVMLVAALAFAIWAIVLMIRAFTGAAQKPIREKAQQLSPNAPEVILEQLDQLLAAQPKAKVLFNDRLIFANNGNASRLYAMNELVWAYHSITKQRVYFIPVGKTHSLTLCMIDGKSVQIPMKEAQVKEYLQSIYQLNPTCFFGYNDEIAKLYRKNPASLPQIRAAQMSTPQP